MLVRCRINNRGLTKLFQGVHDLTSPVVGSHSIGRSTSGRFCRVALALEISSSLRRPSPQAFTPFRGLGLLPGTRMQTGLKVFLALPDACGLQPCDQTHLKNGLVPNRTLVGCMIIIGGLEPLPVRGSKRLNPTSSGCIHLFHHIHMH